MTAALALLAALIVVFGYCQIVALIDRLLDRLPCLGALEVTWILFIVVLGVAMLGLVIFLGTFMEWWCLPVGVAALLAALIYKTRQELRR